MAIRSQFKTSVHDTRVHRGADVGSDHNLVISKAKIRLDNTGKNRGRTTRLQESKLRGPVIRQQFQLELRIAHSKDVCTDGRTERHG